LPVLQMQKLVGEPAAGLVSIRELHVPTSPKTARETDRGRARPPPQASPVILRRLRPSDSFPQTGFLVQSIELNPAEIEA
jgi:hypothetical protein